MREKIFYKGRQLITFACFVNKTSIVCNMFIQKHFFDTPCRATILNRGKKWTCMFMLENWLFVTKSYKLKKTEKHQDRRKLQKKQWSHLIYWYCQLHSISISKLFHFVEVIQLLFWIGNYLNKKEEKKL